MNRLPIAFRRLALSNLAAQSAEQIGLAVAPLVAVLSLGASASGTGLLQTAQTLPFLLLSIPLGVWADRHSRKRIMAAAEGLRALALAATLALLAAHALTLPSLAMLGFVGACGTVAYSVAAPALIPALVGRAALARANGAIELARSAAYSAGPAIGAALVDRIGAQWAYGFAPSFWLAASSFFLLGAGPILWSVASTTLRQAITPPAMLGRVCAINGTATYGARPLGALVGAVVAARFGIDACIWASVGGFVIQAAVIVRSAVSRLERIPDVSDAAPRYAPLPD